MNVSPSKRSFEFLLKYKIIVNNPITTKTPATITNPNNESFAAFDWLNAFAIVPPVALFNCHTSTPRNIANPTVVKTEKTLAKNHFELIVDCVLLFGRLVSNHGVKKPPIFKLKAERT
ncbi:Uncharacterised protein [Mycoplasma putrefaciens]|nr:Uncharacterised protein [Mycoplasma putrefaciens]